MAGRNDNAKIYIEAVLENLSSFAKEFKSGIEKIDTTIPIKIDDKDIEESVATSLKNIFAILGDTKGFAKQLDLSEIFPAIFKSLQSGMPEKDKLVFLQKFEEGIVGFEDMAKRTGERLGIDAKQIVTSIKAINEGLGAKGVIDYLEDVQKIYNLVNKLHISGDAKDNLLNSFIGSLEVGFDADKIGDAIGFSEIADQFEDVDKFALSAKVAREKLLEELQAWDNLKRGTKSRAGTRQVVDIQGYISRIEELSGKTISEYIADKLANEQTSQATKNILSSIKALYEKEGGWGEYYAKWMEKDKDSDVGKNFQRIMANAERVKEMTRRQMEERQKAFEKYGKFESKAIISPPSNTITYDENVEAVEKAKEETDYRKELADKIAQEVNELREKVNLLKEIAGLEQQVITSGVESSTEYQEMEALQDVIDGVTKKVNEKTDAFRREGGTVSSVVSDEVKDLQKIKDKLDEIAGFNNEEEIKNKTAKGRQGAEKQLTEAQKKAQQEAEEKARQEARQNSVLGDVRKKQAENQNKPPEEKPKSISIKRNNFKAGEKPSDKTTNEREAQALKDIAEHAETAKQGLESFGQVNGQISENISAVTESLEKQATALNTIAKTYAKFDDSKIVQQARRDKLKQDLDIVKEGMKIPKKDMEDFQNSFTATVFRKDHLDDATEQLRDAYKDVVSYREHHAKDKNKDAVLEMAKREAKYWDAYQEAKKQGLEESNLEAKRLTPDLLGIDLQKNADNRKLLNDELNKRKAIVQEYEDEVTRIQKEIKDVGKTSPSKKKPKEVNDEVEGYREVIEIIKEYVEAQKTLAQIQENAPTEPTQMQFSPEQMEQLNTALQNIVTTIEKIQTAQTQFNPEQVEQFSTAFQNIVTAIEKIETALGNLDGKLDLSLILSQLEGLNDIFSKFIGDITFDDFKDIFTVTIDEAADKINEFKTALDLEAVTTQFEEQISRMQAKIDELQSQLTKEIPSLGEEQISTPIAETGNQISASYEEMESELQALEQELKEQQSFLKNQQKWIDWYNEALKSDYTSKGKQDAYENLQAVGRRYTNFRLNPEQSLATDKNAENNRFIVKHYRAYQEAQRQKVAESRLNKERFDIDDSLYYDQAMKELEEGRKHSEDLYNETQQVIAEKKQRIEEIKQILSQQAVQESVEVSSSDLAQENVSFENVSDSANEAADAKRNFVEANKEVAQSIDTSTPKVEQEATALDSLGKEDVKDNIIQNISEPIQEGMDKFDEYYERAMTRRQKRLDSYVTFPSKKSNKKDNIIFEAIKKENDRLNLENSLFEEKSGQLSLFPNIQEEKKQLEKTINKTPIQIDIKGQLSFGSTKEFEEMSKQIKEEVQKDYENQFTDYGDGQLTFMDKNTYDLSNEYAQIVQEELDQAQKITEQKAKENPIEIPIEGQVSFSNEKDIEQIGQHLIEKEQEKIAKERAEYAKSHIGDFEKAFYKMSGKKDFLQDTDIPSQFLKQYENISVGKDKGTDATANLRQLKNLGEELAKVKTKLKVSFDEDWKLKDIANPEEVQELLKEYDTLTDKIERLKNIIQSPSSQESSLLNELKQISKAEEDAYDKAEKFETKTKEALDKLLSNKDFLSGKDSDIGALDKYFQALESDKLNKIQAIAEEINNIKQQLAMSRDSGGNIIGNPEQVSELINKYNSLTATLKALIAQVKLPTSAETLGLRIAKDAETAEKKLKELKNKINSDFIAGNFNGSITQAEKAIQTYGAFDKNKQFVIATPEDSVDFQNQQTKVKELIDTLKEYKDAVQDLQTLKDSDAIDIGNLTEASDKVDNLSKRIANLAKELKSSGIANATKTQIDSLSGKIETFLKTAPNLSEEAKIKFKGYLDTLQSGATVSKTAYASMSADLNQFGREQLKASNMWSLMSMKIKEGIAFLATKFSLYQIFNQFRQGFNVIHQFDDALTEMMKVSDETRLSLERYQKTTFETADAIGTSALQIQNSTADFMRLGETLDEAAKSAKAANILMNVSEFQSIDEATKSLIAMGAAYQDLTKMDIIDKLNEVGNNFAISTSEAATALQASASALTTANNDMDEALALITAGNAVVQDATKVGTGMRTIALRLTGTKSAKDELEEMGEETENVITTQSKLRDVIKEATAVASNEYKGFDILDDNGNYKSTYEIMLGIAEVYDEILETDKKFGRNNANLLLENVAGKVRANIAASIFQNPELLKEAYVSSQSADNSAMRENEKYMQSISGHLAQLQNAWQEMWANAANRDVINFFIDLGTAVLKFVNTVGIIPSTLSLLLPYLEIFKRGSTGKGLISSFLEWANGLNEVEKIVKELGEAEVASDVASTASSTMKTAANQAETASALEQAEAYEYVNYTEALESTTDLEGTITSTAKSAANMTEQFSETGKEAAKATSKLGLLGGAFKGLASAIGLPTLAFAGFVAACLIAKKAYDAYN